MGILSDTRSCAFQATLCAPPSSLRQKALLIALRFSPKHQTRARFDVFPERRDLFCRFKGVTFLMRKRPLKINRRTRSKSPGCVFSGGSLPTDRAPNRPRAGFGHLDISKKIQKTSAFFHPFLTTSVILLPLSKTSSLCITPKTSSFGLRRKH